MGTEGWVQYFFWYSGRYCCRRNHDYTGLACFRCKDETLGSISRGVKRAHSSLGGPSWDMYLEI